ncbi:DoxX family protein [Muricauda oceani]|uniref:DoxX family protein n=1 Tax=Flagellimonas oceani TaxID=2698672 RepID=A0A6G7J2C9_9FLAO|nr:DoxX family protein [Allomuricauda oceani]MBW8241295.1 DoxX family protein [Allomuricauda oceani]QII44704.1 DoxX family protein [Allomuricauda oceani]
MKTKSIINGTLRIVPALILLQTLFFKFSAAPESVYIFEQLGLEPWGRIGLGIVELITAILILIPKTTWIGALLGIGIMLGALFSHFTRLGIVVQDDGGTLFILALVTFVFCLILVWQRRSNIPLIKNLF